MKSVLMVLGIALGFAFAAAAKTSRPTCPIEKIRFTKKTGCRNDGSVEFCVPANDERLRAAVKRIAPTVENKGRQRCDPETELLFFLPVNVDNRSCVERWGAMTDRAWNQVCALARLPQIATIRHTIYE